ncbi:cell division protein PerM [Microbacterium sp. NPDC055357]
MHRLIVVILAAVDALIAVAVGLAVVLASLTLLWAVGIGTGADWGALWPASATIWQLGHAVPVDVLLADDYLAETGIDAAAAAFTISLAPLAFTAFTAIFAARSGRRASQAGAWITGVATGIIVFVAAAVLIALTGHLALAEVETWQAVLFPSLVFIVPALLGALVTEWSEAGDGVVARLRDRVEMLSDGWSEVPGSIARGTAIVCTGLVGLGALATAVAVALGGGEIVALFEASHVDAFGATVMMLAQLAYLPTLIVWAMSFVAGPGFSVGMDTVVGPAGTQAGILPGIPVLGAVPESTTTWLLLLALLPVGLGAFAGWIARSRLAAAGAARRPDDAHDPLGARLVVAAGIAVGAAAIAALLATLASGSIGPGTLAYAGPEPGPLALAIGLETALGAGILLLSPRPRLPRSRTGEPDTVRGPARAEDQAYREAMFADDPSAGSGTGGDPSAGSGTGGGSGTASGSGAAAGSGAEGEAGGGVRRNP